MSCPQVMKCSKCGKEAGPLFAPLSVGWSYIYKMFEDGYTCYVFCPECGKDHIVGVGRRSLLPETTSKQEESSLIPRVIDPVCGILIPVNNARSFTYQDTLYWFCCDECKEKFIADPDFYCP